MRKTWNDDQFIKAVKSSKTLKEVIIALGLKAFGSNYKTINKHIKRLNLDLSHFINKNEQMQIARNNMKVYTLDELFCVNKISRSFIRNKLIKLNLIPYKCYECSITHWEGKKLSLHLDHINGINNDNRLDNLRFLCPNCHSLTETYCGKNIKNNGAPTLDSN